MWYYKKGTHACIDVSFHVHKILELEHDVRSAILEVKDY